MVRWYPWPWPILHFLPNNKGQVKELKLKDIKGHWAESIMMEMYSKGLFRVMKICPLDLAMW